MPTDFNALQVFAKVIQTGSFTGAARALGMPKSTVSQRVSELEERLGARLLQRTTRRLNLTDQGRVYFDHCVRIFAEIEEADRAVTSLQQTPRGRLRITVPASTQFLAPFITDYLRRCDGVQIDMLFTDRFVNLVEESFDIAIRAGALSDSTLMARTLGSLEFLPVASPRYLRKHGRPRSSDDLGNHRCLVFGVGPQPATWRLIREDETRVVDLTPVLSVNDLDVLHDAVVGGVGIAVLPAYRCVEDLRARRLERVLPEWGCPDVPIHALYPSGRHLSPKVKLMLDHLQKMTPAPWKPVHSGGADAPRRAPRTGRLTSLSARTR